MQQVVMVVPVNPDVDETQNVSQQDWNHRLQRHQTCSTRRFHFQHHDCDDDGKNTVTERFKATFVHISSPARSNNDCTKDESTQLSRVSFRAMAVWKTAISLLKIPGRGQSTAQACTIASQQQLTRVCSSSGHLRTAARRNHKNTFF